MVASAQITATTQALVIEAHRQNVAIIAGNRCWLVNTKTGKTRPCPAKVGG